MLMRRHFDNKAKGATETKVAPKPLPKDETVVEVDTKKETPAKEAKKSSPSRMEIMRMNVATVRAYAEEQGIEGASAM